MPAVAFQHPTGGNPSPDPIGRRAQELFMLDILMLALGLGLFGVAVGYTFACERL
jgi:hypothetical protein